MPKRLRRFFVRRAALGGAPFDTLTLNVDGNTFEVPPRFTVTVNGAQVGGEYEARAARADELTENFTFRGRWGPGPHTVKVTFVNDVAAGAAGDRNVYVNYATFNGAVEPVLGYLFSTGDQKTFSVAAPRTNLKPGFRYLGVNLSSAEFGTSLGAAYATNPNTGVYMTDYNFPPPELVDHYIDQGLNFFRLPVQWERVQPTMGGALEPVYLGRIDAVIEHARTRGAVIAVDIHNYAYGYGRLVGSAGTPDSALADLWSRLATHWLAKANVMFDLMNEPNVQTPAQWLTAANAAIAAIRATGATHEILVPGTFHSNGASWVRNGNSTDFADKVVDPFGNITFEVHQYNNRDQSGSIPDPVSPTIGVERLVEVTAWAERRGVRLFLGEFGAGRDAASLLALKNQLDFIHAHSGVWQMATLWAGGPWWPDDYLFSTEPKGGVVSPQVQLLRQYAPVRVGAPSPLPGLVGTFDYLPARDGLALLGGGPTQAGYAAEAAVRSEGVWTPRFPTETRPKGMDNVYNGEFQWYVDPAYPWSNRHTPFAIQDGALRIRAQRTAGLGFAAGEIPNDPATGVPYEWVSGVLTSRNRFLQCGGYFEAEIKFAKGRGGFPAFWLLPASDHPPEIDIVEYLGHKPNTYHGNAIAVGPVQDEFTSPAGADLSLDYHRFGLDWTDSTLRFFLDGVLVATKDVSNKPEFGQPMFILLNAAIGTRGLGDFVPPPDATTPNPSDMLVRSVRAWQRPGPTGVVLSALSYLDNLPVGGTVATITAPYYGGASAVTYAVVSDPDAMFAVQGDRLTLTRAVLANAAASHQVRLRAVDAAGRSWQRAFVLRVLKATPSQPNLIPTQNLTNVAWGKENVTVSGTTDVMEAATNTDHLVVIGPLAKPAMASRYETYLTATPINGRNWLLLQWFDADYTASALAWFNVAAGTVGYYTQTGLWATNGNVVPFVTPLGGGSYRVGFAFTSAAETGLRLIVRLATGQDQTTYLGETTRGMRIADLWLYDMTAPTAGGNALTLGGETLTLGGETLTLGAAALAFNALTLSGEALLLGGEPLTLGA